MALVNERIKEYWEEATPMSFDIEKWTYEQKRKFRYDLQDYMHGVFGFEQWAGKKVLDIGCGSGIDAMEFARNGADVTAVDITQNALNLTLELMKETRTMFQVRLASADNLPFSDNTFDLIYSFGVLHHIPNIRDTLREVKRVLKPGGSIMVMLYHKDSLLYAYSIMYLHGIKPKDQLFDEAVIRSEIALTSMYSERNEGCPYTKAYTKDEARIQFGRYFGELELSVHYNVLDLPGQRKVKVGIDDKWELGWHLVVKGKKVCE